MYFARIHDYMRMANNDWDKKTRLNEFFESSWEMNLLFYQVVWKDTMYFDQCLMEPDER